MTITLLTNTGNWETALFDPAHLDGVYAHYRALVESGDIQGFNILT